MVNKQYEVANVNQPTCLTFYCVQLGCSVSDSSETAAKKKKLGYLNHNIDTLFFTYDFCYIFSFTICILRVILEMEL